MRARWHRKNAGQTFIEALLLLPVVLLFVFGLLQSCQIGVGLIVVNYGASSIARKASRGGEVNTVVSTAQPGYNSLMIGGLKSVPLKACRDNRGGPTSDVVVVAQAKVRAFPVVGPLIDQMAPGWKSQTVNADAACREGRMPAISFSKDPEYTFTLNGVGSARRNYLQ